MSLWARLWGGTDIAQAVRGQELVTAVAIGCVAFTSASSSVLHAGVGALAQSLRRDLGSGHGTMLIVEPAGTTGTCPSGASGCAHRGADAGGAIRALHGAVAPLRQQGHVASISHGVIMLRANDGRRRTMPTPGVTLSPTTVPPTTATSRQGAALAMTLLGADAALFGLQALRVRRGRLWTPGEVRAGRPVALLGQVLFDTLSARGAIVRRGEATDGPWRLRVLSREVTELEVVGVIESPAVTAEQVDRAVVVPPPQFVRITGGRPPPSRLIGALDVTGASSSLLDALRRLERRVPRWAGVLAVTSTADQLGDVAQLETALRRGVRGLSLILVLASVVAVGALMVTIARAHARAVGIVRALGATRRLVVAQGALIGAVLGGAGVVCGAVVAAAVVACFPSLLGVPAVGIGPTLAACLHGSAPALVMSVVAGTVAFRHLAWRRPATLLG